MSRSNYMFAAPSWPITFQVGDRVTITRVVQSDADDSGREEVAYETIVTQVHPTGRISFGEMRRIIPDTPDPY